MTFGRQQRGQIVEWNDEKGYGFIRDAGGSRLFFHATDVQQGDPRPMIGDDVAFGVAPGRDGRPSARPVRIARSQNGRRPQNRNGDTAVGLRDSLRIATAAGLVGAAVAGAAAGQLPIWLPLAYLAMGGMSYAFYWRDKAAALTNQWRTPEATLHMIDVLGGVVGGLVAQVLLRHKNRKSDYAVVTAGIVLLHAAAIIAVLMGVPLLEL